MSVRIPIEADPSGVVQAMQAINSAIERAGQGARAFKDLDLSHPELVKVADDLRKMNDAFDTLRVVGRGRNAAAVRAGGYTDSLDWMRNNGRQFTTPGEQQNHTAAVGGYLLRDTQTQAEIQRDRDQQRREDQEDGTLPPADDGGGGDDGGAGGGRRHRSGGSFNPLSLLTRNPIINALMAWSGIKGVASMVGTGISSAKNENSSVDALLRRSDDGVDSFNGLRDAIEQATKGLQLTYEQSANLALSFTRLSDVTDQASQTSAVRAAAGLGIAYGTDPNTMMQGIGQAGFMGIDSSRFAQVLGETIERGDTFGQIEQTMNALLNWSQASAAQTVTGTYMDQFAALYAGLNATGEPGFKGQNASNIINQLNSSFMGGGSDGLAGQVFMQQALANAGLKDPYEQRMLMQSGMFATIGSVNGTTDSRTGFDVLMQSYLKQYPTDGSPAGNAMQANGFSNLTGLSMPQAQAFLQFERSNPHGLSSISSMLSGLNINPNTMSPTSIRDLAEVADPHADISGLVKSTLARPDAQGAMYAALRNAKTDSARRAALAQILATSGGGSDIANDTAQAGADVTNSLTKLGQALIPVLNDVQKGFSALTGPVGDLAQKFSEMEQALNQTATAPGSPTEKAAALRAAVPWFQWQNLPPGALQALGLPADPSAAAAAVPAAVAAIPKNADSLIAKHGMDWNLFSATYAGGAYNFSAPEQMYHLDSGTLMALALTEGHGSVANLVNTKSGAAGIFQLMSGTAGDMGVSDRMDPGQSAYGAARYWSQLLTKYRGNVAKTAAAYDWGDGNLDALLKSDPNDWYSHLPKETSDYVRSYERKDGLIKGNQAVDLNITVTHVDQNGRVISVDHQPQKTVPIAKPANAAVPAAVTPLVPGHVLPNPAAS